jgi:hypothetical protein
MWQGYGEFARAQRCTVPWYHLRGRGTIGSMYVYHTRYGIIHTVVRMYYWYTYRGKKELSILGPVHVRELKEI